MQDVYTGKIFGIREFVRIVDKAVAGMMSYGKEIKLVDKNFRSLIMLAVTQVNGCQYCSYVHTKQALKSGSSEEDLAQLMEGDLAAADSSQRMALLFAQHYADTSGSYDAQAYERLVESYGKDQAAGILASIKMIMMGNANGGAMSLFIDRLHGKRNKDSSLGTELVVFLGILVILPAAFLKNLIIRSS
ncbi:carboxymuconolactone decarboxylase family protein [Oceanispirochaeta crateris]|uniref:Carboxymuconolactone decarboxylase family protein n=1 Tax=Oceanispirochaeta crateris TaxID=2518645 RepID=A0A5C1QK18_9SPIO|nr:carboxymuconolactone decarboxylase family protein [Oceanispirochaeta crateris]QEN08475.1 carboxymuconolactone decarboxylase family protein [Oceanispirochaeta crateris]